MHKDELLKIIEEMSVQKILAKEELLAAFERGQKNIKGEGNLNQSKISQLLYYIGGGIVFIGIAVLIGQQWTYLGTLMHILLTLGIGLGFFTTALLARQSENTKHLAQAFFFIAGLLLPVGLGVTFDAAGLLMTKTEVQSLAAVILFAGFLAAYMLYEETVLLLFTIIFGTWLYGAVTGLLENSTLHFDWRFECYRSLVVFISYLCLGYYYTLRGERPGIREWLLSIGSLGILGFTLVLGGWKPNQSLFWELIYPFITFGFLYWSIVLRNRAFLSFGAIALVGYLGKITSEYFADSIGWPLTLVILGMIIILIGYWAVYLNKKYIAH